jgi:hypothetical protein
MDLGLFAGPIYTAILLVDCLLFLFLEWWMPREDLHFVHQRIYRSSSFAVVYSFVYVLTF